MVRGRCVECDEEAAGVRRRASAVAAAASRAQWELLRCRTAASRRHAPAVSTSTQTTAQMHCGGRGARNALGGRKTGEVASREAGSLRSGKIACKSNAAMILADGAVAHSNGDRDASRGNAPAA